MALAVKLGVGVKLELSCKSGSDEYIVKTAHYFFFFVMSWECSSFLQGKKT